LKLIERGRVNHGYESPPTRGRGLKQFMVGVPD